MNKENLEEPLCQIIKSLIFASTEPLSIKYLCTILPNTNHKMIVKEVQKINEELTKQQQPFEVLVAAETFMFRTRSKYEFWVQKLFKDNAKKKLSMASLEVLSIVAYKQPITKSEIEDIRGVSVDTILKNLLERKFLTIVGRSSKIGSPNEYGTTKDFCRYFGINQVPRDLPKFSEFSNLMESSEMMQQIKNQDIKEKFEDNIIDKNLEEK